MLARHGSAQAIGILAEAVGDTTDADVSAIAFDAMQTVSDQECINAVCEIWFRSRNNHLEHLIVSSGWTATSPPPVAVFSALKTRQGHRLTTVEICEKTASALVDACLDSDAEIAAEASLTVGSITRDADKMTLANPLCQRWTTTRSKLLEKLMVDGRYVATSPTPARVFSALKTGQRALITDNEIQQLLLSAHEDPDEVIREQARLKVGEIRDASVRETLTNLVCKQWSQTRSNKLAAAIKAGPYVATQPFELHVLSALKASQRRLLTKLGAEVVPLLLKAAVDTDAEVSNQAELVLRELKSVEAREAVCRLVLEENNAFAVKAVLAGKYGPQDEHEKALLLFLTEQWERYEEFDFDRRLLLHEYEVGNKEVQQRIRTRLTASGRTDFLTLLATNGFRQRAKVMSPDEIKFLVETLQLRKEWNKLWNLVFDLPFMWSLRVVRSLAQLDWRPSAHNEISVFGDLVSLASSELISSEGELSTLLPPATCQARAYVPSRANTVAFSPSEPIIAIGTSNRRICLWDFKRGTIQRVINGFDRSVGSVSFLPDGTLLCAERTNDAYNRCVLRCWKNNRIFKLKEAFGSLTAVEPVDAEQALIAGRDQSLELWDIQQRQAIHRSVFDVWARGLTVSSKGDKAALLYDGVSLINLPEMNVLASTSPYYWTGVVRCAAFAPNDDQVMIVGKFNGEVLTLRRRDGTLLADRTPLCSHFKSVQSIQVSPTRSLIISGGAEGVVNFTSWGNRALIGNVRVPGERLTSLHVSANEDFMVVGDSDSSISFWDLRVLDIPMLFALPLAKAVPNHLAAISAAVNGRNLKTEVLRALQFIEKILRHRFRYDIHIDDLTTIRPGEYDIVVEG